MLQRDVKGDVRPSALRVMVLLADKLGFRPTDGVRGGQLAGQDRGRCHRCHCRGEVCTCLSPGIARSEPHLHHVSDTSACVLLFLFYYLVEIPSLQDDLRNELSATNGDWHAEHLEKLPLLNALIKETMRLFPPLATSGLRTVGPSGLQVGDTFVPPGITIAMPMYSFGRRKGAGLWDSAINPC
jgi:hypothetical protein